ncbi:MAG: PASTA domain-containing protein [Alistipes sp.]|nr:PASTA domain-containing protein [Alistipes sp.]MBQ5717742.1 PASTA domain-containing protein [Alistipes sp.]
MAQKKNEGGLLKSPLLKNIVVIALLMVAMLVVAHILMLWGTRHGARRVVPDLSGVALSDAERIARENDLELHINDSLFVPAYAGGIILDQLPEGGVEVKPGRTVYITINSFRQKMVPVPYVAGRSLRQAKNMLEIAGLEIKELIYRPDMATNYVLEQFYDRQQILADSRVEAEMGSGITLYVGVEPEENVALVPQVVGLSLRDAKSRLWESGLNVGKIDFEEGINLLNQKEARLYAQSPSAETATTLGSEVTLRLTLDTEKVKNSRTEAERLAREAMEERLKAEQAEQDSLARLTLEQTLEQAIEQTEAAASEENFFE